MEPTTATVKENSANKPQSAKVYDKDLVRTDSRNQKIEKFLSMTSEYISSSLVEERSFAESNNDSVVGCFEDTSIANDRMKLVNAPPREIRKDMCNITNEASENSTEESEIPQKKSRCETEQPQLAKKTVGNKMQLPNVVARMPFATTPSGSSKEPEIIEHSKTICTPRSRNSKLPVVNKGCVTSYIHTLSLVILNVIFFCVALGNLQRRAFDLTSLSQLRATVQQNADPVLRDTFKNSIFVGCASKEHALFQHHTRLYVFNITRVAQEFFYQTFLNDFGNLGVIRLSVIVNLIT